MVYRSYLEKIGCRPEKIDKIEEIPFLPISLFRTSEVKTGQWKEEIIFLSSGTTSMTRSRHFIPELDFYHKTCLEIFRMYYDDPSKYVILSLMPSINENPSSSLIQMVNYLANKSGSPDSGFYLGDLQFLRKVINRLQKTGNSRLIIWGITYALLDLAASSEMDLTDCIVIETGGMKGRREELIRREVHEILKKSFQISSIHSEYGMTELHSQTYAKSNGRFQAPPWMKILTREINDPLGINNNSKYGAVNIIDLANFQSCAFIATEDVGIVHNDGMFEIIGRMDYSDVRGCNLLLN